MSRLTRLAGLIASLLLPTPAVSAVPVPAPAPPAADVPPTAAAAGPLLRLLTLNTWGLPMPDRRARFDRIRAYLAATGADLVGLQEVWRGAHRLLELEGLRRPARGSGDSGLALLTDHEVSQLACTPFSVARGVDGLKRKGVLEARVEVPGAGPLWVFVTHLQAGRRPAHAEVRSRQIDELLERVEAVEGPAVVLGDFNLHAGRARDVESAGRLGAAGLVDAAEQAGQLATTHAGDGARHDRVLLRSGGGVRLDAERVEVPGYGGELPVLSDHQPVVVHLRVTR